MMYKSFGKRLLDLLVAIPLLILIFPALCMVWLLLLFSLHESPIFIQKRPGLNSRIFDLYKFKTMNSKKDVSGNLLPDEERLTQLGKFFRSISLDELPQLINVVIGDMSLIGPRPLLVKYLDLYTEFQLRRHEVRPGITGWAQVNGRNALDWESKFRYDVWYIDNISFLLDLKILFLTVKKVLIREGISGTDSLTMKPFEGSDSSVKD
jgi:lipopolysaccharide/colanic/teichoic acid biosynthesis glycosyltransferase